MSPKLRKPKRRNVRVLLLHPGQPDRWATVDPSLPTLQRVLPLLEAIARAPDDDLIFYSKELPQEVEASTPYHCLVRGKPVWDQIMILKRAGEELVNMERADIARAYAYIAEKRRS